MPLITVFTPTYNRKNTLVRTYESLRRQTSKNFIWMVIDDGSDDGTGDEVLKWKNNNNGFEIRYCYKENGGLHTGYNKAIELADTELMVCVDSDDWMPDDAIELICRKWEEQGSDEVGGIIGLDYHVDGSVVGNYLPETAMINLIDVCVGKLDVHGDKKQVMRVDCMKRVAPIPEYPGEKNFNPYYMILEVAKEYEFLVLNENLCFVEYQQDGMSNSMLKQYLSSPRSFAETRLLYLSFPNTSFSFKFRHSVHLVSSCILLGKAGYAYCASPCKMITALAYPAGYLLAKYIKRRAS